MSHPELFFLDDDEYSPLPDWAHFGLRVGDHLADALTGDKLWRTALAVPTRAFVGPLIASACIAARAGRQSGSEDTHRHLKWLMGLPEGTVVKLLVGDRWLNGKWAGHQPGPDCLILGVRVQSRQEGGRTKWISGQEASRIQPSSREIDVLPKKQKGRKAVRRDRFIELFTGGADPVAFAAATQLDVAVLGRVDQLRHETFDTWFACARDDATLNRGTLHDVMRVRRFLGQDTPHRSEILPVGRRQAPTLGQSRPPWLVIFDGSLGFLRWRDSWRSSHWVVILDRTEGRFQEAVGAFNSECMDRSGEIQLSVLDNTPPCVEMVSYQEDVPA